MRLTRYSAIDPGAGKPCDIENEAITLLEPSADPDGEQQLAEGHALGHRPHAAAVCLGIYICAAVIGWGLIDVAIAVWLR